MTIDPIIIQSMADPSALLAHNIPEDAFLITWGRLRLLVGLSFVLGGLLGAGLEYIGLKNISILGILRGWKHQG